MKITALLLGFLLALCACEQNPRGLDDNTESGVLSFQLDVQQIPSDVAMIEGSLIRDGFDPLHFDFDVTEQSASKILESVAIGIWKVKIDAYNGAGDIIYTASKEILVVANEVTPVYIHLMKTGSLEIIVTWGDDRFEGNDSQEQATPIWEYHFYEDLYVSAGDDDWYSIDLSADSVSVICQFHHENGDINVDIVDSHGEILKSSQSKTDNEVFSFIVDKLDTYYIHVYSLSGNNNRYTLWWDDIIAGQYP